MKDWNNRELTFAFSKGGVLVVSHPYDNLIRDNIYPWPPSEIIQKLYKSKHTKVFEKEDMATSQQGLGYYCDLQSIHSEDAITWSVFGPVALSQPIVRNKWISDLFSLCGLRYSAVKHSEIFLWRRVPHPDTLVLGGPEIDFGIVTDETVVLGEAKWKSMIAKGQGKQKNKNQIELRSDFLRKYGQTVFPGCKRFRVILVSLLEQEFPIKDVFTNVSTISITWDRVCSIQSHPRFEELQRYLEWKKKYLPRGGRQKGRVLKYRSCECK